MTFTNLIWEAEDLVSLKVNADFGFTSAKY